MRDYFFISDSDGALHDTRDSNWSADPLRPNYRRHHRRIETVADFKACLRAGELTDLGGYPLYFITADNAALSFDSARAEFRQIVDAINRNDSRSGWRIAAMEINYEDSELVCDHSGTPIPCAYGDT